MKAIGKLVLGALMLAGTTAAVAPAAEAAWYGGYGYGPGWGRPGAQFDFGVGPAWRGGHWDARLAWTALRLVVDGWQFLVPLSASGLSLSSISAAARRFGG